MSLNYYLTCASADFIWGGRGAWLRVADGICPSRKNYGIPEFEAGQMDRWIDGLINKMCLFCSAADQFFLTPRNIFPVLISTSVIPLVHYRFLNLYKTVAVI